MPGVLVGEAPGFETLAVRKLETRSEQVTIRFGLRCEIGVRPIFAVVVAVLSALDVDFGEVYKHVNVKIPLHIDLDVSNTRVEIDVLVELEADAINSTASVLQVLDKLINGCGFDLPIAFLGGMVEVIVEKECRWIGLPGPLERLTHEVIDILVPDAITHDDARRVIVACRIHCLVDHVPRDALAGVSSNSRLNVFL